RDRESRRGEKDRSEETHKPTEPERKKTPDITLKSLPKKIVKELPRKASDGKHPETLKKFEMNKLPPDGKSADPKILPGIKKPEQKKIEEKAKLLTKKPDSVLNKK